ncbi:MAG: arsenate reductase (glutaredoxin) [Eikenella sp.]|nr:arsenate reductase (glutaredoxin) [Eikenella sp.]
MSDTVLLYHNPRCSKSRAALEWLEQHSPAPVRVIDYQKQPPSEAELAVLLARLGLADAAHMMRRQDSLFAELGLNGADNAALIRAMHRHPALIERPIAVYRQRAAIGRPLDNIAALFD